MHTTVTSLRIPTLALAMGALLIVLAVSSPVRAEADEPDADFECDFESGSWWTQWGEKNKDPHVDTVLSDDERAFEPHRGRALRVRIDEGGHDGVSLTYRFEPRTGSEPEEVFFRYYLRLGDDWDPRRGGKLPGIAGTYGRAGWGGRKVDGTDGWSARGLFMGRSEEVTPIGFYCYHADMQGRYGDHWVWDRNGFAGLQNNRWYCIEQQVRLNSPAARDGILRGWVDGKLVFERTNVRMRTVDRLKIETVWLNVYHGGTWTAPSEQHLYIDDVVVSRNPIGPLPAVNK